MRPKPTHSESDTIDCQICLVEIPRDLARSDEATGYVHYFCGESCYVEWREGAKQEKPDTSPLIDL